MAIRSLQDLSLYTFIDVEATGLHTTSYPIEVGWCGLDLKPSSLLIRPLDNWTEADWSSAAEAIHGISRETLFREGIPARECAQTLNEALKGRILFSDNPAYDGRWLRRLFADAGVETDLAIFNIDAAHMECIRRANPPFTSAGEIAETQKRVRERFPHPHRAGPDSLGLAAFCRALHDREWSASLAD